VLIAQADLNVEFPTIGYCKTADFNLSKRRGNHQW